jgi:hypothetical protein
MRAHGVTGGLPVREKGVWRPSGTVIDVYGHTRSATGGTVLSRPRASTAPQADDPKASLAVPAVSKPPKAPLVPAEPMAPARAVAMLARTNLKPKAIAELGAAAHLRQRNGGAAVVGAPEGAAAAAPMPPPPRPPPRAAPRRAPAQQLSASRLVQLAVLAALVAVALALQGLRQSAAFTALAAVAFVVLSALRRHSGGASGAGHRVVKIH